MARQKGIIRTEGTIGDLTFLKNSDVIKRKSSISRRKLKTDPAFIPFGQNGSDMGSCSSAGRLVRDSIKEIYKDFKDKDDHWRMAGIMRLAMNYDQVNERGSRKMGDSELGFLKDYEFNSHSKVNNVIFCKYQPFIDRAAGVLSIKIPTFFIRNNIVSPKAASHFQLVSAGVEIDFEQKQFVSDLQCSEHYPLTAGRVDSFTLLNKVTAASIHPLFLVFGIRFYRQVNENYYPLFDKKYNALKIVDVVK
jgi:hypothetical protein